MAEITTTEQTMAEPAAPAQQGKEKKTKLILLSGVLVALLCAGGGGYWFFILRQKSVAAQPRKATGREEKKHVSGEEESLEEDAEDSPSHDKEKVPPEKSTDRTQEASADADKGRPGKFRLMLPDDKEVRHVVELQPFIVNLADEGQTNYLRMTVSIGIGESDAEKPDPLFTTRVRNALLAVLTTKTSAEVLTPQGKEQLRRELLRAARQAVGEPVVQAVYITDFIVQL